MLWPDVRVHSRSGADACAAECERGLDPERDCVANDGSVRGAEACHHGPNLPPHRRCCQDGRQHSVFTGMFSTLVLGFGIQSYAVPSFVCFRVLERQFGYYFLITGSVDDAFRILHA